VIELFFAGLRSKGLAASWNKYVQYVKAMFRWATKKGYLARRNPTAESEALKREQHARRDRRLEPGEEAALLEHAGAHLSRVIIAALETVCRRGNCYR
jgi:hypothetical protein